MPSISPGPTATATTTPTMTLTPVPVPPVPFTPVIAAIVVAAGLLLIGLCIAWCALRGRRPRPPTAQRSLQSMLGTPVARPKPTPGNVDVAHALDEKPPPLPHVLIRMRSCTTVTETARSGSEGPAAGMEARPFIPYCIPGRLEALYAAPVGGADSRSSSQPTSARSAQTRSPKSLSVTSADKLAALRATPISLAEALEPLPHPTAAAAGQPKSSRLRIINDPPLGVTGLVWTAAPQHGTWTLLPDAAGFDRHPEGWAFAEAAGGAAGGGGGPAAGLAVVTGEESPRGDPVSGGGGGARHRRRRRSSVDSDHVPEGHPRRTRYQALSEPRDGPGGGMADAAELAVPTDLNGGAGLEATLLDTDDE